MPVVNIPGIGPQQVSAAEVQRERGVAWQHNHNHPRRIDHFANTSLDESGPVLPPLPRRRTTPAELQAQQEAREHRQARQEEENEARRERKAGESADRKAARLQTWRKDTEPFRQVLTTVIKAWTQTGVPAAAAFEKHFTNAMLAADKEKTVYDIAGWFPNLPHHVQLPLRDLCQRLHGEAKMMYDLVEKEDRAGGMQMESNIHPELLRDPDHLASLAAFDQFDTPHSLATVLTERQVLFRIQAQLETRKMLLQPGAKNRHGTAFTGLLNVEYLNPGTTTADLKMEFNGFGNNDVLEMESPVRLGPVLTGPAKAVMQFESSEEAAKAHVQRRKTTIHGIAVKITHVTPDRDRTTTWKGSIDAALCGWSLAALDYVKGKLNAFNRSPTTIQEGQLIATVHNQLQAFRAFQNFDKIAHIEAIEEEYVDKVMMDSYEGSTPELRAELDQLEDKLEIFEEQLGDGILGQGWRMSQRSRRENV